MRETKQERVRKEIDGRSRREIDRGRKGKRERERER